MDEYFCPNCGATLNDQYGFDPNGGSWTCTACGMHLMDDDVYEGDTFEGVAWYCDDCGELLNRQSGFSDSYGSWRCTNCGHLNGTTEDDIINTGPQCPSCSAYLKRQSCYSEYDDDWTCEVCGAKLHRNYSWDSYEVVHEDEGPECPNCGSSLKRQYSFYDSCYDYTCSECGKKLHRSYSSDPFEVVEEDDGPECPHCGASLKKQHSFYDSCYDYTCDECGAKLHRDYSYDPFEEISEDDEDSNYDDNCDDSYYTPPPVYHSLSPSAQKSHHTSLPKKQKLKEKETGELRKIRMKAFLLKRKKIVLGFDPYELLHKNVDFVRISLHNQAFNNITTVPIKDIDNGSPYSVGEVEQVVIGGSQHFDAEDMIPYDTEIVISYHEKKEIALPFNARYCRRKNFTEIGDQLQSLGFTEIYERPIKDLTTGWVVKDGSIEKVTVGGNDAFKKNAIYAYDTKIVIEYHTFKKTK